MKIYRGLLKIACNFCLKFYKIQKDSMMCNSQINYVEMIIRR